MAEIAAVRRAGAEHHHEPRVQLLVADDDPLARSQLVLSLGEVAAEILVLEAEDGAEAIQLALQRRPDIALLDINMPRLGGIEAAITLRQLQPRVCIGLQTGDPLVHRQRAHEHRFPLFDKLEFERRLAWLRDQVEWCIEARLEPEVWVSRKRSFVCRVCGYGALRAGAPDRCPMCHAEGLWVEAPWRHSRGLVAG